MDYTKHLRSSTTSLTPQTEAASPLQAPNNAGGYAFTVDMWQRLSRFLILGAEGGTYYVGERKLVRDNAKNVEAAIAADARRVVDTIVAISDQGRAPKNDPALFALALACKLAKSEADRRYAYDALPKVARIGTHLFHFAASIEALGGWGRATKRAFAAWYLNQDDDDLITQVIKYQQRDGWSHRDILRKAHPHTKDNVKQAIFGYVTGKWSPDAKIDAQDMLGRLAAVEEAKTLTKATDVKRLLKLIDAHDLPREVLPTEVLKHPAVWEALLVKMPVTAMIRNLGKMTSIGVLAPLSANVVKVVDTLSDVAILRKGRVHPLNILVALKTYAQGHGEKGSLAWTPNQQIVDALNGAFYTAFQSITPTGKRHFFGVDVSGSMASEIAGLPISSAEAAGALAMVSMAVESYAVAYGFCDRLVELRISPRTRLDQITAEMQRANWGSTDCAGPIKHALKHKIGVDAFVVITDCETNTGRGHAHEWLEKYRQAMDINAKMIVVGTTATDFTIADPNDSGQLDVVGFDTSVPAVMADFIRG